MNPLSSNSINRKTSFKHNIMTKELHNFLLQEGKLAIFLRVKDNPTIIDELINNHELENLTTKLAGHISNELLTPLKIKESLIEHGNKMIASGKFIANFYQKSNANEAYNSMFEYGKRWMKNAKSKVYHSEMGLKKIKDISAKNLKNLRNKLGNLTSEESSFLSHAINTRFIAKHFTDNPPAKKLLSRNELTQKGIKFATNNSTDSDITQLANNFFVFLSLEPTGDDGKGFKSSSRFGATNLVFEFNEINQQYMWLSTTDQLIMQFKTPEKLHLSLAELAIISDYHKQEAIDNIKQPKIGNFFGQDMIIGLTLSIILLIRQLPHETNNRLLTMHSPEQLNLLINSLYRPEIKIPHHLTITNDLVEQKINNTTSIIENSSKKFLRKLLRHSTIKNNGYSKYNSLDPEFNDLESRYNELVNELSKDNLSFTYKHNIICGVLNPRNPNYTILTMQQRLQFIEFLCFLIIKEDGGDFSYINYLMSQLKYNPNGTSENQVKMNSFSAQELELISLYT